MYVVTDPSPASTAPAPRHPPTQGNPGFLICSFMFRPRFSYETTSSEESSGEDNVDDSSEPEEQEKSGDSSPQEPTRVEAAGSDGDPSPPVPCAGPQDNPPRG